MSRRNLTKAEIDDILKDIPRHQATTVEASEFGRQQIVDKLEMQLRDVVINPAVIGRYKRAIINKYYISQVQPGEAVGILAAESISQPITQAALGSYHRVGIGNSSDSQMKSILEIFKRAKKRSVEQLVIHFLNNNMSYEGVQEIIYEMEGITINSLISNKSDDIMMNNPYHNIPWLPMWAELTGEDTEFIGDSFFRLKLNVMQLYTYNISLDEICDSIKDVGDGDGVKCIPSPTMKGIIDIFIDEDIILKYIKERGESKGRVNINIDINNARRMYYTIVVKRAFNTLIRPSSIKGLKEVRVVEEKVMSIFDGKEKKNSDGTWYVYGNALECMLSNINNTKISGLFKSCGLEILDSRVTKTEMFYHIRIPQEIIATSPPSQCELSPIRHVNSQVEKVSDEFNKHRERMVDEGLYDLSFDNNIWKFGNYVYAIANSNSFMEVLAHPEVNSDVSIIRNPYEVYLRLGIEASRNMYIREIYNIVISSGSTIAPVHIELIANNLCSLGMPIPATSRGASKQGREAFADAAFEKPLEYIFKSALHGHPETTESTSTCIFFGKLCRIGTGLSRAGLDPSRKLEIFEDDADVVPDINIDSSDINMLFENQKIDFSTFDNRMIDDVDPGELVMDDVVESSGLRSNDMASEVVRHMSPSVGSSGVKYST